jgi:hypothetical protein
MIETPVAIESTLAPGLASLAGPPPSGVMIAQAPR